jgi:DNA-binding NtrC family response regulator
VEVNVRVVASTTRDLTRMVQAGTFREDFLHRINTIRIVLPALRERVVDVPLLAAHFLAHFGEQFAQRSLQLGADATSVLERYRWPGNVRELRNVMERAALLATDGLVSALDLPLGVDVGGAARPTPVMAMAPVQVAAVETVQEAAPTGTAMTAMARLTLGELERRHIADVLEQTLWHQGRAADLLGISPKTLYRKIREYGFRRPAGGGRP